MNTESGESGAATEWKRTGKKSLDELHLYETGKMYDCTLRVGNEKLGFKDFKCHKVILGCASGFFERMLFGNFKEASFGRDEPIEIKDVDPAVFDIAMKFIYGNIGEFGSALTAVDVFKFAHFLDATPLMEAVEEHLMAISVPAEDIFASFDLYVTMGKTDRLEQCWKVINEDCDKAFASPYWLTASPEAVAEVMKNDSINIAESGLIKAFIEWAKTRCPSKNGDDLKSLRTEIDPFLKYVRFGALSAEEFFLLGPHFLNDEEKLQILHCIVMESTKGMPDGFSTNCCPRDPVVVKDFKDFWLHFGEGCDQCYTITFKIDHSCTLIGVFVDENVGPEFSIHISNAEGELIATANSVGNYKERSIVFLNCALQKDVEYSFELDCDCDGSTGSNDSGFTFGCNAGNPKKCLHVTFMHERHACVTGLVLKKSDNA